MKACSLPRESTKPQAGATGPPGLGQALRTQGCRVCRATASPRPLPALLASSLRPRSDFAYGAEWPPPDSLPSLTSPLLLSPPDRWHPSAPPSRTSVRGTAQLPLGSWPSFPAASPADREHPTLQRSPQLCSHPSCSQPRASPLGSAELGFGGGFLSQTLRPPSRHLHPRAGTRQGTHFASG